jgi:hypothetical protein
MGDTWILECSSRNSENVGWHASWYHRSMNCSLERASWLRECRNRTPENIYRWRNTLTGEIEMLPTNTEQPTPKGTGREILPLVIADLVQRTEKGIATYGEPLRADNGRDALRDAYEEELDLAMYLRQAMEERK